MIIKNRKDDIINNKEDEIINIKEEKRYEKEYDIDDEFDGGISKVIRFISKKIKLLLIILAIITIVIFIIMFINKEKNNNENNNPINNETEKQYKYSIVLKGKENITIYQGEQYIEPGYTANDNYNNDLTNQVIINNQVDVNKIGTYQITYKLNNITKIRTVTVIEKIVGDIEISLKGNETINLTVGQKYEDPGYTAVDLIDGDITYLVKTISTLDTNKPGTYQITYMVTNSTGATESKIRTIIVSPKKVESETNNKPIITKSEINLTASTTDYTNKDITIKISITDSQFKHLLLPNGTKTTNKNFDYKVSANGTYKFISVSTSGNKTEKTITINNIDKEAPSGTCSGSYQNGKSKIKVNATDNIGISKYVINDIAYVFEDITINKELKKVDITIHDKVGNTKTISCELENKN